MSDVSATLKFLILGSDSQVGTALQQLFDTRQIPYKTLAMKDVVRAQEVSDFLTANKTIPFVINACFEEPQEGVVPDVESWVTAAKLIAQRVQAQQQSLFMVSSSLVFSGHSTRPYHESDKTDATSTVGKAFIELEKVSRAYCERLIVLRTGWVFSEQVGNFLTRLVGAAISQESLRFSGHLKGCPTDAHAVARVLLAMAEQVDCGVSEPDLWGTYHYVDSDVCSMHTFAKTVITVVKSMTEVRVESIEEGDSPDMIDAVVEPESYELACKKILSTFGIKQRPWRRSIHEVLKTKFSSQA